MGSHKEPSWVRPYTYFRLMRILQETGFKAEVIWQGYKAQRRKGYQECYRIIRLADGKTVVEGITLDSLRRLFTSLGFPLEDRKSMAKKYKGR